MSKRPSIRWRDAATDSVALLLSLALAGISARCQTVARPRPTLPLLTTAHQITSLNYQQAVLAYPVHLHGVVTLYDPRQEGKPALFMADATGGVCIMPPSREILPIHAGSIIDVTGVSDPGGFAPIVEQAQVHLVTDTGSLPETRVVTLPHMLKGLEDSQWVGVEGLVHSVEFDGKHVILTLATDDGLITVTMVRQDGVNYASLIDAKVMIPGVVAPLVNNRQLMGVRLLSPEFRYIKVEESAPTDPFSLPVQSLGNLLTYSSATSLQHRIHLQGRVTLDWPGRTLCILVGSGGLCTQIADQTRLQEGELVDLTGFPARSNYEPTLSDASLRRSVTSALLLSPPSRITSEEALQGDHTGQLVQIEGRLIGKSLVMGHQALILSSGKMIFPALLPTVSINAGENETAKWIDGSEVLVTGVFSGKVDERYIIRQQGLSQLESFQILMRSPSDVLVIDTPSWWNGKHALMVLGVVFLLTCVFLLWVVVLRRRVEQQTRHIRLSEEKYRHLAQHDTLTGLAGRSLMMDRLEFALEQARKKQIPFALMMMDVDHFKLVNDTLGHAVGDEVLRIVAKRIQASVRDPDTVARMGGDEFTVLLAGIDNVDDLRRIAQQTVNSVASPSIIEGRTVLVSLSVGVTAFPIGGEDASSLLHSADLAMYRAKILGRNRYQIFTPEMIHDSIEDLKPRI